MFANKQAFGQDQCTLPLIVYTNNKIYTIEKRKNYETCFISDTRWIWTS